MNTTLFLNTATGCILFLVLILVIIKLTPAGFRQTLFGTTPPIRRLPRRLFPRRRSNLRQQRASPLTFHPYREEEDTIISDDEFISPSPIPSITTPPPAVIRHGSYRVPPIPTRAPPSPPSSIFGTSASSTLATASNHSNIWGAPIPPSMVVYDATTALESPSGWYPSDISLEIHSTMADDMSSRFSIE